MNCPNCNMPLEANARFCRNCGTPIPITPSPNSQAPISDAGNTILPGSNKQIPQQQQSSQQPWSQPPQPQQQPWSQQPQQPQQQLRLQQQPPQQAWSQPNVQQPQQMQGGQLGYYQPNTPTPEKQTLSTGEKQPRQRTRGGCLLRIGIVLVVIVLLVTAGWFLGLQPFLNSMAKSQINQALSNVVDQIPPIAGLVPTNTLSVSADTINAAIALKGQSGDIVTSPTLSITSNQMRVTFQVFGFSCAITGVPIAKNGKIVFTNVALEGIMTWILSPDDITTIFNQHLADVETKLNRTVTHVQLQDQGVVLTLGPSNGTPFPFPITPGVTPTLPFIP